MQNKKWLTLLSGALLLSHLVTFPILAQESDTSEAETTEESISEQTGEEVTEETSEAVDLFAIGADNPFTEEELAERIVLLTEIPEENLYTYDEVSELTNTVIMSLREAADNSEKVTLEAYQELIGDFEPSEITEAGSSQFHRFVAVEPLKIVMTTIQFYDEGNGMEMANIEVEHNIPSNYEPLDITEDEIVELSAVDGWDTELVNRIGLPALQRFVHLSNGVETTYTWRDDAARELDTEDGTIEELIINVDSDLRFESYEMFFVGEDATETTTSEESTEEASVEEEASDAMTSDEESE